MRFLSKPLILACVMLLISVEMFASETLSVSLRIIHCEIENSQEWEDSEYAPEIRVFYQSALSTLKRIGGDLITVVTNPVPVLEYRKEMLFEEFDQLEVDYTIIVEITKKSVAGFDLLTKLLNQNNVMIESDEMYFYELSPTILEEYYVLVSHMVKEITPVQDWDEELYQKSLESVLLTNQSVVEREAFIERIEGIISGEVKDTAPEEVTNLSTAQVSTSNRLTLKNSRGTLYWYNKNGAFYYEAGDTPTNIQIPYVKGLNLIHLPVESIYSWYQAPYFEDRIILFDSDEDKSNVIEIIVPKPRYNHDIYIGGSMDLLLLGHGASYNSLNYFYDIELGIRYRGNERVGLKWGFGLSFDDNFNTAWGMTFGVDFYFIQENLFLNQTLNAYCDVSLYLDSLESNLKLEGGVEYKVLPTTLIRAGLYNSIIFDELKWGVGFTFGVDLLVSLDRGEL